MVMSKGHASPVLYSTLAEKGFFPQEMLKTFRQIDSPLSGHVEMHVPGVGHVHRVIGAGIVHRGGHGPGR